MTVKDILGGIRSIPWHIIWHGLQAANLGIVKVCVDKFTQEDIDDIDQFLSLKGSNASLSLLLGTLKIALQMSRMSSNDIPPPPSM